MTALVKIEASGSCGEPWGKSYVQHSNKRLSTQMIMLSGRNYDNKLPSQSRSPQDPRNNLPCNKYNLEHL